ncbi:MAG: hypothetical protein GY797_36450 [Deltaproteobacteria bacterium]|nr:hypothetical protein [Deltaproteobacteria bacterium]
MNFSTREAALGFAELLGRLWPTGIDGIIHFRLADTYTDYFGGWVGHGLFADGRGTHSDRKAYEPFPVYWVFANLYKELGSGEIVKTTTTDELTVVAARKSHKSKDRLAVWVSNYTKKNYTPLLRVSNFPANSARIKVIDNLVGDTPIENTVVEGKELSFKVNIPRKSSYLFTINSPLIN